MYKTDRAMNLICENDVHADTDLNLVPSSACVRKLEWVLAMGMSQEGCGLPFGKHKENWTKLDVFCNHFDTQHAHKDTYSKNTFFHSIFFSMSQGRQNATDLLVLECCCQHGRLAGGWGTHLIHGKCHSHNLHMHTLQCMLQKKMALKDAAPYRKNRLFGKYSANLCQAQIFSFVANWRQIFCDLWTSGKQF